VSTSPSPAHRDERMPPTAPAADPRARRREMPGLLGKNVLVTGGTSGIGQATAVRFAEHGANVAINYPTTADEAAGTAEQVHTCLRKVRQHGVRDVLVEGDVSSEDAVVGMVREAGERLGGLDILINNAGIQISRPSEQLSGDELDQVLAVNLRGSFLCAREAIKRFLADEKPGVVINVSSVHELIPRPNYLSYSISKGGMGNLTRTLALEYARRGIRVNGVGPGATITPINRAWTHDPIKMDVVASDLRRRRFDPVRRLPRAVVGRVSDEATAWWPSPFGPEDELGMLNHITDATRAQALRLVRSGRLYDLGRVLDERAPVFPGRYFRQTLVTTAHHANGGGLGTNRVNWITEQIACTQQLGTHLDALCHLQIGDRGYNGWSVAELADTAGAMRLGVETVPQIVTRGWLVDVAPLDPGEVIGVPDIDPAPGDAVLFHTGWGEHWYDADTYLSGEPGPGMELAHWLVQRGVALTGCDTWSYGPLPAESLDRPFEVPQFLNARHGVFIVENLDTAALARDGVREFALILTHPKLRGASGAWTSPIAMV
jgi:NAD(P)-dependent dehydrogenase (short-subunit alcohol dehydrogenase family)/kynurenine formamidase